MSRSWKKEEHTKLLQEIREILEETTPTPEIFSQVTKREAWNDDYLRYNLLPDALKHLKETGEIEIAKKRHEGGRPTHYWRLSE